MNPMTSDQATLFLIMAATLVGFVWGRWRFDVVAGFALLASVYLGIVPAEGAFMGFGHPAVITVAAVLIISRALQNAGLINIIVRLLAPSRRNATLQVAAGSTLTVFASAFMNNVGALALMLPVTIRGAQRAKRPASQFLIPLSFVSLLGGLITLIGTPPNIVIAAFRQEYSGTAFAMFDFTPVGLVIAVVGVLYLSTVGWRLLPNRTADDAQSGQYRRLDHFIAEVRVPQASPFDGRPIRFVEDQCENEITILAIIRDGERTYAPPSSQELRAGDVLAIQGDPTVWEPLCDGKQFTPLRDGTPSAQDLGQQDFLLAEAVVMPSSSLEGVSVRGMRMHENYGINLLALARSGEPPRSRLRNTHFRVGDVLLLQGERTAIKRAMSELDCLVLLDRGTPAVVGRRVIWPTVVVFAAALVAAALGLVSIPIALASAGGLLVISGVVSLHDAYDSIEWPIIVLLGALIPIGQAMKSTGAAQLIADTLLPQAGAIPLWTIIAIVMAISMWLSDLIHNTPTAVIMAPIAASIAEGLAVSVDPFLMAVAVGSASPYLTPVGHQSNTLVMGPGAYRFTDYARVGGFLEILILLVGVPMIMLVWGP